MFLIHFSPYEFIKSPYAFTFCLSVFKNVLLSSVLVAVDFILFRAISCATSVLLTLMLYSRDCFQAKDPLVDMRWDTSVAFSAWFIITRVVKYHINIYTDQA